MALVGDGGKERRLWESGFGGGEWWWRCAGFLVCCGGNWSRVVVIAATASGVVYIRGVVVIWSGIYLSASITKLTEFILDNNHHFLTNFFSIL